MIISGIEKDELEVEVVSGGGWCGDGECIRVNVLLVLTACVYVFRMNCGICSHPVKIIQPGVVDELFISLFCPVALV